MIKEGTKIIKYAEFENQKTLEEIIIPDSVKEIEGAAFRGCTALKRVVIPDSVTLIRNYAFAGCTSLEHIELPENIFVVEPNAFQGAACEGKVTYKGACKRLFGNTLFTKKDHQTHIEIPEGVIRLEDNCFRDYTELETVTFPKSLKTIGTNCFMGCTNLKEVHFHEGMYIGWHSFEKCKSLRTIELPEKCKVGELTFGRCENLNSIRFPQEADINWSAFYDCPAIEKVYAPEDADYHQLFKRLPEACQILNLDGEEMSCMKIQEWNGEVPEEALIEGEKLQGKSLEEQLDCCYIVETTSEESSSYGESDGEVTRVSKVPLKTAYDFDVLLVKDGTIVGFVNMKQEPKFLGQICKSYSAIDSDGPGSTYVSSVSYLRVIEK